MAQRDLTKELLSDMHELFPNHALYTMKLKSLSKAGKKLYHPPSHQPNRDVAIDLNVDKNTCLFFTPNGEFENAKGQRTMSNCGKIYAFIAEIDVLDSVLEEADFGDDYWKTLILHPTIVTKTKKGFHCFWVLNEGQMPDKTLQALFANRVEICGGDKSAKDFTRLLRYPGSVYRGDNQGTITVDAIYYNKQLKYDVKDFQEVVNKDKIIAQQDMFIKSEIKNKGAWEIVDTINNAAKVVDVIKDLSGGKWHFEGTIGYEDGKETSGYRYYASKNGLVNFTSDKSYRPVGSPFAVAKNLLGSLKETFEYFSDRYGVVIPKATNIQTLGNQKIVKHKDGSHEVIYPVGNDDASLVFVRGEGRGVYYEEYKQGVVRNAIVSGFIQTEGVFYKDNINHYVLSFEAQFKSGYLVVSELGKPNVLEKELSRIGITTYSSPKSKAMKALVDYIHNCSVELIYVDKLGYQEDFAVFKTGSYIMESGDSLLYVDIPPTSKDNNGTILRVNQEYGSDGYKNRGLKAGTLTQAVDDCIKMYEPHISVTALIWACASVFVYTIRKQLGFFPHMVLFGVTQSGKTTIRRRVTEMIGFNDSFDIQASTTHFSIMKMKSHYMPLWIAEFDNVESSKIEWPSFLKNTYDGTADARGTGDQKLIRYESNAALCIDGEVTIITNSVFTRSIQLSTNAGFMRMELKDINYTILDYLLERAEGVSENISSKYNYYLAELTRETSDITKPEKKRMISNYAVLCAMAEILGSQLAKKHIVEQMFVQFSMMGMDSVNATIKDLIRRTRASSHKVDGGLIHIDYAQKLLIIGFLGAYNVGSIKMDEKTKAQIQAVNNKFNIGFEGFCDELYIPLDYMMQTTEIHTEFNYALHIGIQNSKRSGGWAETRKALAIYAEKNNYTDQPFYSTVHDNYYD